jgi:hypothetical protein
LSHWFSNSLAMKRIDILRIFRGFNAYAEPFRKESEAHET